MLSESPKQYKVIYSLVQAIAETYAV